MDFRGDKSNFRFLEVSFTTIERVGFEHIKELEMTEDTRDNDKNAGASTVTGTGAGDVPKSKLPKGMILGKDGKP